MSKRAGRSVRRRLRPIPGWRGYFAGNDGHIYSNRSDATKEPRRLAERTYARDDRPRNVRYKHVFLTGSKRFLVSRLVCLAFHGPAGFADAKALHRDDRPENNVPGNLRWGTQRENYEDSLRNGTAAIGERHGFAKLTADIVREIRSSPESNASLAKRYGVDRSNISRARYRKTWRHIQ